MKVRWLRLGLSMAVTANVLMAGVAAAAFNGHEYSIVYETTGGTFNGILVNRPDINVNPAGSGSGCTTYYNGSPVYQTMWVQITLDGKNWEELGTADQCQNFDYLFWGYAVNQVWHPLGQAPTPGGTGNHTFSIKRDSTGVWRYSVDGVQKGADSWTAGKEVSTGLESYADIAVPVHAYFSLQYQVAPGGAWQFWSGRDVRSVGPDMCGRWNTDTDYRAGEHATC